MPELEVMIGGRPFQVSCQPGEEHFLRAAAGMLDALTRALDFVWVTGNHDGEDPHDIGGTFVEELELAEQLRGHALARLVARPEVVAE